MNGDAAKREKPWAGLSLRLPSWLLFLLKRLAPIVLLVLGLVLIGILDRHTRLVDHKYAIWLFDYETGFARRSLIGAILDVVVGDHVPLSLVDTLSTAVFWLIAASLALCIVQVREWRVACIIAVLFAFSPMGLKNLYLDYGRLDSVMFLYVCLYLLIGRNLWTAGAMLLASPILLLIHEVALFIAIPVMVVHFWASFGEGAPRSARRVIAALLVLIILVAVIVNVAPAPAEQAIISRLEARSGLPVADLGTSRYWAFLEFREVLPKVWPRIAKYDLVPFALFFIPTLAFIHRLSKNLFNGNWRGWAPLCLSAVGAVLFAIALDWARWASLCVMIALLCLLSLAMSDARRRTSLVAFDRVRLLELDTFLVAWTFLIPDFGISEAHRAIVP